MKRTFAQRSLQTILAVFFVVGGLMLTATRAEAQQLTLSQQGGGPTVNWMSDAQASQVLAGRISDLHGQLQFTPIGSQPYVETYRRIVMYKTIHQAIANDSPIASAIQKGVSAINLGNRNENVNITASKTVLNTLKQEATNLLSL